MLTSICPLGERARRQHYWVTITTYVVASTAAAAALGAALGLAGSLAMARGDVALAVGVLGVAAALGLVVDHTSRSRRHVPGPRRQVNEDWLAVYRGWVYGAGYGAQLGLGVTTYVVVSAVYVVLAAAFVVGSPLGGAIIGGAFGLARALPVLLAADVSDPARLRVRMRSLVAWQPAAHRTVLLAQAAVVVTSLGLVLAA